MVSKKYFRMFQAFIGAYACMEEQKMSGKMKQEAGRYLSA